MTYFLPWTHSSAIVFPDGHDLGVASDSGGGGGGVDMDLDMDLLASSLEIMDDDNNDNTMFAMTNLGKYFISLSHLPLYRLNSLLPCSRARIVQSLTFSNIRK